MMVSYDSLGNWERLASIWPGMEIITFTVNVILFPINKSPSYRQVVNSLIIWNYQKSSVHQKKIRTGRSLYCAGPNDHQVTSALVNSVINDL